MKKHSNVIIGIILLCTFIVFIRSIHNFIIYFVSISDETMKFELKSKILPPLLGAFLSGIVALLIFYLTKLKEDFTKRSRSKMYLDIIEDEMRTNLLSVKKLSEIISGYSSTDLSTSLVKGSTIAEQFKVLSSNLSIEIIDKFLIQLNKDDYLKIASKINKFKLLINSLSMLNNDLEEDDSKALLIERLKGLFEYFFDDETVEQTKKYFNIEFKDNKFFIVISILFFTILYTAINIVLIKLIL